MVETAYDTLTAYVDLLDGISVEAYKTTVLPSEAGNYVLVRFESETTEPNNTAFFKNPVIVLEVVTKKDGAQYFINSVNPKVGWDIMNECMGRIYGTSPGKFNVDYERLGEIEDLGTTELIEEESNPVVHRLIKRFLNRTFQ